LSNVFADEVTDGVATVFPHDPPRFLARTPHGYYDIELIGEELSRHGEGPVAGRIQAHVIVAAG